MQVFSIFNYWLGFSVPFSLILPRNLKILIIIFPVNAVCFVFVSIEFVLKTKPSSTSLQAIVQLFTTKMYWLCSLHRVDFESESLVLFSSIYLNPFKNIHATLKRLLCKNMLNLRILIQFKHLNWFMTNKPFQIIRIQHFLNFF